MTIDAVQLLVDLQRLCSVASTWRTGASTRNPDEATRRATKEWISTRKLSAGP